MKRLVFMVEGKGDVNAIPSLVARLVQNDPVAQLCLFPDGKPYRIGGVEKFTARHQAKWPENLKKATERPNLGAILVVFDGDADFIEDQPFCARAAALALADRGKVAGAGKDFSLGVVFLCREYESLLIAAGRQLAGIPTTMALPTDPERHPRDAKGWLDDHLPEGYHAPTHQHPLTQAVTDWQPVRDSMRCFRRLESAIKQLAEAVTSGTHIVSPQLSGKPLAPEAPAT